MIIGILSVFAMLCIAFVVGKLVSLLKLPSILGWLIAGMLFGPYLVGVVNVDILDSVYYQVFVKLFECFAGVMIGSEIVFKRLAKYGKQLTIITLFQSLGTFFLVTLVFLVTFLITGVPVYLAFIFGGIALATAPAPALSIINEFGTKGPVTDTLIPVAAIDDVIAIVVFFTIISIVSSFLGSETISTWSVVLMTLLPFVLGIITGLISVYIINKTKKNEYAFAIMILFLIISTFGGLLLDKYLFKAFSMNYLLIGMAYSAVLANLISEERFSKILKMYNPLLTLSFVIVIVNLGMPLNYQLILGAGLYTAIYIVVRSIGKIGGSYIGGKVSKADKNITRYLGFTLLPHSGVSLVFAGIAVATLSTVDNPSAVIIQGTIAAAAIINEIIAVIVAKQGFKWANEIPTINKSNKEIE